MDITIYTLPVCPNCEQLKETLNAHRIKYTTENIEDPEVYAKLLLSQVIFTEAPFARIDGKFMDMKDTLSELGLCSQ